MKKEQLLNIKKEIVQKELSCTGIDVSESDLTCFSVRQLKMLCDILKRNQETAEKRSNFVGLSTTEVLCKTNGKIIDFDFEGTGEVKEISREYARTGAAKPILEKYEKEKNNN